MSTTLRVSNGDVYFSEATGKSERLGGIRKTAQDLMEEFLTEFDADENRGTLIRKLRSIGLIRQEVAEAVERLRTRQMTNKALSPSERIVQVNNIVVQSYDGVHVFFYVNITTGASKEDIQLTFVQLKGGEIVQVDQQLLPLS